MTDLVDQQEIVDALCHHAVKEHRLLKNIVKRFGPNADKFAVLLLNAETNGSLTGLRIALCVLHGWDAFMEADDDGLAEDLIHNWWKRHHPEDWTS